MIITLTKIKTPKAKFNKDKKIIVIIIDNNNNNTFRNDNDGTVQALNRQNIFTHMPH